MNIAQTLELDKVAEFSGEWEGEEFTFSARSHKLTPKIMQQFADSASKPVEFAAVVAGVVTAWSLDWNGEPFPPTVENVAKLPYDFLNALLDRVGTAWTGEKKSVPPSASGSGAAAK